MIEKVISSSIRYPFAVLTAFIFLVVASIYALRHTPLDALPDLSPPQVIVEIKWQGQSPDIIESQGTYPLVSQFLSISDIETVRGISTYETGFIYIIFKEGVDLYWARSRVLEQLASIQSALPEGMKVSLGPDASGVGWAFEYALVSHTKNLEELRLLQDYYYKYALMGVEGVSEVATVGGFVPTFEVTFGNQDLVRHNLSVTDIVNALKKNNNDTGGRIAIQNGFEWMIQARGYIQSIEDIASIVVSQKGGIALRIGDFAKVRKVPAPRRGLAELDGKGEVVGGIVVVRYGEDVYRAIERIKQKLQSLKVEGVEVVTTYDRSSLIEAALSTLKRTLIEEGLIVVVVIALFLSHLRSSLIVLIVLPVTVALTFLLMWLFGIGSNIMSLGGIAIAIGAMVDASIVMIENAHKKLHQEGDRLQDKALHTQAMIEAASQVGRPIFFALLLVTLSFLPIFALSGQEGKLFHPLAYTKTFAMAVGAFLSITLVPVLMVWLIKGRIVSESKHWLSRIFMWIYTPMLWVALRLKWILVASAIALVVWVVPRFLALPWEFMPQLDEQSVMYMPVTAQGISIDQAKALTQYTDAIIKSFPEVERVFGKAGRAETSTDPAPLGMLETIITFKPKSQWREGLSTADLIDEMDEALQVDGLSNSWTFPIRGRIDMLISGIRTPLGIKVYGESLEVLQDIALQIEQKLAMMDESDSVTAERTSSGYYLTIDPDTKALARYGVSKEEVLRLINNAVGGKPVTTFYDGIKRYPVALRLQEDQRRTPEEIGRLLVRTSKGFVPLETLAKIYYRQSASVIKSEQATPVLYVTITPKQGVSASVYQQKAKEVLKDLNLPSGYRIEWAGESQYLQSAMERLAWIVPAVLVMIFVLIVLALREAVASVIVFLTLPFAFVGGVLYLEWLGFSMSIATVVGFLALLGIAAETAIVMIVYLQEAVEQKRRTLGGALTKEHIRQAIREGALLRLRPKLMTVFAILAGLLPIMYVEGVGSEVMRRIAAPMIGGMVSSAVLSLLLIPAMYEWWVMFKQRRTLR